MAFVRALWRLCWVTWHVVRGLWIVLRRFDGMPKGERVAAIGDWSRTLLGVLGVQVQATGQVGEGARLLVANHVSWLDIMALHSVCPHARFVSKSDVHHWPVIGRLVAGAGTLFIERERKRDALRVVHQTAEALRSGDTVAIFPEGTTSDGHALLPFHANLLQAAISAGVPVQPFVLRFAEPGKAFSTAAPYIGDMTLVGSLWRVLTVKGMVVHVEALTEEAPGEHDRRSLSDAVRRRMADRLRVAAGLPTDSAPA